MGAPNENGAASSGSGGGAPEEGAPRPVVGRIGAHDGDLLRRVRLDAIAESPGDFTTRLDDARGRPAEAWDRVAEVHATADDQATWFARVADDVAGMVSAFRTDDGAVTMTSLWSAPGYRRVGVADVLVETVREWSVGTGAVEVRQWLVERNAHARAFHESLGFVPTGAERPYEPSPDIREVELRLPLRA
ncbi:GNAT family N-acetyltransferase [Iamia sp. SCSIO 61187]|uniref:GNAT family N-acetyltransferase n=1 Tax=Iamia sp. SCSIO 61187 TaxID=2722752 RepID=UPI001C62F84E|nr:GNAT family N-acetyltransferase [Iamia sp. SCSIO 61187]QYG93738.1 GNAT family N-acetyltransferase [Iamia sp. SCSIO 61187]